MVEAAGARAVLGPRAPAQPAPLVPAAAVRGGARHVHAAAVLLDGRAALGALFGVGDDPVDVLCFARHFLQPSLDLLASRWRVITNFDLPAQEAKQGPACTTNGD